MMTLWLESISAALLAALAVVLCVAIALHWGQHREEGLMPYIFYQIVAIIVLTTLLSGRNLYASLQVQAYAVPKHPLHFWFTNISSLFFTFVAVERIGRRFLDYGRRESAQIILAVAFSVFFLTNYVTSALLGTEPSFDVKYFYWYLAGFAAILISAKESDTAVRCVRNVLFVYLIIGALFIPWRPQMVLSAQAWSLLPGLRYAGLSSHPNSLGAEVNLFLLCLLHTPYRLRWLTVLGWAVGCASLIFSQSKTNWIVFAICVSYLAYFGSKSGTKRSLAATLLIVGTLATTAIGALIMFGDIAEKVGAFFDTRIGADLLTLTGRTKIWAVALDEWRKNPLFGYGLMLWSNEHRAEFGASFVGAHNQFIESLTTAGIVGLAGLVVYSAVLFWFSLKTVEATRGLSLALFLLLFIRSITESTLSMEAFSAQMLHLLLLMVVGSAIAARLNTRRMERGRLDLVPAMNSGPGVPAGRGAVPRARL